MKFAGFLALGGLLLYLAFKGIALEELGSTLRETNFWWIGLSLFFLLLSFMSRARRWMLLIEPLGFKPSFWNTFHSMMFGYLSNYALPRLGEVTRCVSLGRKEKIPVDSLIGTVIAERAIDLMMLLGIMFVLLLSWMDKFGAFFTEQVYQPLLLKVNESFGGSWMFWLIVGGGFALIALLIFIFRKKLSRFSLVKKFKEIVKGVMDGLLTITRMKRKWEFILQSLLIYTFYIVMTWVVVFSLEETSGLTIIDGMFLLVAGGLGMAAPVTAGFGAFHWITSRAMVHVYGFSLELGGAYAILAHESNSIFTILLGITSYLLLTMVKSGKKAKS